MNSIAFCPKCKEPNKVETKLNLLGERVKVIQCRKCKSISVRRDGLHWNIIIEKRGQTQSRFTPLTTLHINAQDFSDFSAVTIVEL